VELALRLSTDIVSIDPKLIRRVCENLIDNSLRHTSPGGHVEIEARREGEVVRIAVSNDGPAVPVDEREEIFFAFVRGRSPSSRPGTAGIGLYFCRRAVQAHDGKISVTDTPRWPTSFVIELPVIDA
jgi:signal transduction histidine kinase